MSRPLPHPLAALVALAVAGAVGLTGCGGGSGGATASPTVDPTEAQLQQQLDDLPAVDGASRTARTLAGTTLTETFTVPAGTPACLQVLARLDAGGYEVVTGSDPATGTPVVADTCRTATGAPGTDTSAGTVTVLARGGSQIALTWTPTTYTLTAAVTS